MSTPAKRLASALRAITSDGKPEEVVALARTYGIDGRLARRAAREIPVNANAYLKLCAACGIDPMTGATGVQRTIADLDRNRLAIQVLLAIIGGNSLRKLAKTWKVEYTAINRAKHQLPVNVDNFLKICAGLRMHPHAFLAPVPPEFHAKQSLQQPEQERASA